MTEGLDGSKRETKNGWKTLSIVLMGILAFGVTVATLPQAMAKPPEGGTGDQMMLILTQIQQAVFGIKEKTDNLPDDPASQSALFTQVIAGTSFGWEVVCTSDDDFIVHVYTVTAPGSYYTTDIDKPDGGLGSHRFLNEGTEDLIRGLTVGGGPNWTVTAGNADSSGGPDTSFGNVAFLTLQTTQGAEASCLERE